MLGNIRKISGDRFKAMYSTHKKTNAEAKAKYFRNKGYHSRIIKHGNEYYVYKQIGK